MYRLLAVIIERKAADEMRMCQFSSFQKALLKLRNIRTKFT